MQGQADMFWSGYLSEWLIRKTLVSFQAPAKIHWLGAVSQDMGLKTLAWAWNETNSLLYWFLEACKRDGLVSVSQ